MSRLAEVAERAVEAGLHGTVDGQPSNLQPLVAHFPGWKVEAAEHRWCAAFVYDCCMKAGYAFSIRPAAGLSCHLAGCIAWEAWAKADPAIHFFKPGEDQPQRGDIVLYDRVFDGTEHDHMGIVLAAEATQLIVAEGNVKNRGAIMRRRRDGHIRAFIRLPESV